MVLNIKLWSEKTELLRKFLREEKRFPKIYETVKINNKDEFNLGDWFYSVRRAYKENRLSEERIDTIDKININWKLNTNELKEYNNELLMEFLNEYSNHNKETSLLEYTDTISTLRKLNDISIYSVDMLINKIVNKDNIDAISDVERDTDLMLLKALGTKYKHIISSNELFLLYNVAEKIDRFLDTSKNNMVDLKETSEFIKRNLSNKEYRVIELTYGLPDTDRLTLRKTGEIMGVSQETVRNYQTKAMAQMKYYYNKSKQLQSVI